MISIFSILVLASGSPWISSSFPLDEEFIIDTVISWYGPAEGGQDNPAVSFDGTNYFVVWSDDRGGIYGTRVTLDGVILDPVGVPVAIAQGIQHNPRIVFDGTNYFVVWFDRRNGMENPDIYGTRVTTEGVALEPEGIPICTAPDYQVVPQIAFDGTNYFVVWMDRRSGSNDIYGSRITVDGEVIDTNGFPICTVDSGQEYPGLAFGGTNYFVVWHDYRDGANKDIYGARVTTEGAVLEPSGIPISVASNIQANPEISFDGTNFFVVWEAYHDEGGFLISDLYGTRVTPAGVVLDPSGIAISTGESWQLYPEITYDGTNYIVAWHDMRGGYDLYSARVTPAGVVLDPSGIFMFSTGLPWDVQWYLGVASSGTNSLVVSGTQNGEDGYNIYGARLSSIGTVLDSGGVIISTGANSQFYPDVAGGGTNFLVVWEGRRSPDDYSNIYGMLVNKEGKSLDTSILVSTAQGEQKYPKVAYNGENYLVVWKNINPLIGDEEIFGARVTPNGSVLDYYGIIISGEITCMCPAVAAGDTNFLVVWADQRDDSYNNIYGARVTPSGTVLDQEGISISTAPKTQNHPQVAYDGTNFFVVWEDKRNSTPEYDIYGARVTQNGEVLDTNGILIFTADDWQKYPELAFDGTNYLVVWYDGRNDDIYGARVTPNGEVLDTNGIPICTAGGYQKLPAVAVDTGDFLVVWQDGRGSDYDIYGVRVTPEGTVGSEFSISTLQYSQNSPTVSCVSDRFFIAYHSFTELPYNSTRILGRLYRETGIEETENRRGITDNQLEVYPNPARGKISIQYVVGSGQEEKLTTDYSLLTTLTIYDLSGRLVKSLPINQLTNYQSPFNQIIWDRTDNSGRRVCSGIYFVKFKSGDYKSTKKLILMQ